MMYLSSSWKKAERQMSSFRQFLVRVFAFPAKEFFEIWRQPRLVLLLILGPFAILGLFGFGFQNEYPPLRTMFVVPRDSALRDEIVRYATGPDPRLLFAGLTESEFAARQQLRSGHLDMVVVTPESAYRDMREGEQVVFIIYHNAIDPAEVNYIQAFSQLYVDEINRDILREMTRQGQERTANAEEELSAARRETQALRAALQADDEEAVQEHSEQLDEHVSALGLAMSAIASWFGNAEDTTNDESGERSMVEMEEQFAAIRGNTEEIRRSDTDDQERRLQALEDTEQRLTELEVLLFEFRRVDPHVLVSPIRSETQTIAPIAVDFTAFYAPGVIALLLQHLCVTLAALSIVTEKELGTVELFRVSPLAAIEILVGKYLSYILIAGLLAALLGTMVVYLLGVPILGSWVHYVIVLFGLIFTSLGFGFLISLASESVSQAVQYAMIMLLLTVFFSGFFQSLDWLRPQVRVISLALPATYGIRLLQDIMLRGEAAHIQLSSILFGLGAILFVSSWLWLSHALDQQ
jgi:ABC-2 type transport system permease protein